MYNAQIGRHPLRTFGCQKTVHRKPGEGRITLINLPFPRILREKATPFPPCGKLALKERETRTQACAVSVNLGGWSLFEKGTRPELARKTSTKFSEVFQTLIPSPNGHQKPHTPLDTPSVAAASKKPPL